MINDIPTIIKRLKLKISDIDFKNQTLYITINKEVEDHADELGDVFYKMGLITHDIEATDNPQEFEILIDPKSFKDKF